MAHNGLYKALIDGKQGKSLENGGNFGGNKPPMYAGANPASQLHAQGKFNLEGQKAVNDRGEFIGVTSTTTKPSNASNLNFASSAGHSQFDLDGLTPSKYSDKVKSGESDLH